MILFFNLLFASMAFAQWITSAGKVYQNGFRVSFSFVFVFVLGKFEINFFFFFLKTINKNQGRFNVENMSRQNRVGYYGHANSVNKFLLV